MNNIESTLIMAFLAITFLQSAADKIFDWKGNTDWLKSHFANTILKNQVPLALAHILVLELISGLLAGIATYQLVFDQGKQIANYAAIFSAITLLMLLFGQRLAKDYDGARTIVIYFIPTILALYFLK